MRTLFALVFVTTFTATAFAQLQLPTETAIDRYVRQKDDAFTWKVVSSEEVDGMRLLVIDMTSQKWLTEKEVNRTEWRHWVTMAIPKEVKSDVGFLMIGGGDNEDAAPKNRQVKLFKSPKPQERSSPN